MGLSSLLFGGLTLLQAKSGATDEPVDPTKPLTVREVFLQGLQIMVSRLQDNIAKVFAVVINIDPQTFFTGLLVLSIIFLIAHSTRPSDQSFRSYLTDLQVQEHLRRIRSRPLPDGTTAAPSNAQTRLQTRSTDSVSPSDAPDWIPDERPNPHASTFANRISISIRTPPYVRHDYFLFSLIMVRQPTASSSSLFSAPRGRPLEGNDSASTARTNAVQHVGKVSWYVGVFGHWFSGARDVYDSSAAFPGPAMDAAKRGRRTEEEPLEYGVLEMDAVEDGDCRRLSATKQDSPYDSPAPDEAAPSVASNPKAVRRKKNANRLRPSQISAAAARSTAVQKKVLDDSSRHRPPNASDQHATNQQQQSHQQQQQQPPVPSNVQYFDTPPQASADAASTAASLAEIDAAIKEYEAQLASLKSATDLSQEQLQAQLDELRQRKRDDDAARLDLKGRTKGLDEGKRQAEASRRDADKRLKTAQGHRDAAQSRIQASREALQSFASRKQTTSAWVQKSLSDGKQLRETLSKEQHEDEGATADVETTLAEIHQHIERLEAQVAEEQGKFDEAQQQMRERIAAQARQLSAGAGHGMYDDGYGTGGAWPNGYGDAFDYGYYEPGFASSRRPSEDPHSAAMMYGFEQGQGFQGQGMAPADGAFFSHSSNLDVTDPASHVHTPRQQRSLHDMSSAYTSGRRKSSIPPTSPFSMDLLPSNLFQNLDEDAHPGTLPGHEPDQIEAALNQFGLDTPDQSDVDGNQSDRDTADSILDAQLGPLSEHGSEDEGSTTKSRRNWWGSKSRQASKDRPTADTMLSSSAESGEASAESQDGNGKRRSFGVWPRLSLNPGAKTFRSASRKQADADAVRGQRPEGYGSEGYLAHGGRMDEWGAMEPGNVSVSGRSGSKVIPTQFDAVRRAFEASNPPDEEEGRRSWSAFDQWSQRQGLVNHGLRFNEANTSSGAVNHSGLSRLGQESFKGWGDDVFQPLGRASSAEGGAEDANTDSAPLSSSQGSRLNRSRFAFWNQNSKTSVSSGGSGVSDAAPAPASALASSSPPGANASTSSSQEGVGGTLTATSNDAAQLGSSPASSTASKAKRGFRWTRKRESTANSRDSAGASAPSIDSVQEHESGTDGDGDGDGGATPREDLDADGGDGAAPPAGSPASSVDGSE